MTTVYICNTGNIISISAIIRCKLSLFDIISIIYYYNWFFTCR